jgi:hypothetical protein
LAGLFSHQENGNHGEDNQNNQTFHTLSLKIIFCRR